MIEGNYGEGGKVGDGYVGLYGEEMDGGEMKGMWGEGG